MRLLANQRAKLFLIIFTLIFIFIPILPQKAKALAPVDQVCSTGVSGSTGFTFLSHDPYQVFIPTKNTLDAIEVYIKADVVQSATVRLDVFNVTNTMQQIGSKSANITDQWSWVTFDLNNVTIPFGMYAFTIKNIAGHAVWKHGPSNCYDRGYAVYDNQTHLEFDYGFAVYAYDEQATQPEEPADPGQPSGTSGTSSVTAGSGQPPAVITSSAVAAPLNLKAEDYKDDHGGNILLYWLPSTAANIDGYKIFRSESESSGFVEIAKSANQFTNYVDTQATIDKTFYYLVRAYKGSAESANSNIASVASKDDLTALINELKKDAQDNSGGIFSSPWGGVIIALFILGLIFLLVVGFILFMVISRRKKQAQQSEPTQSKT